MDLLNETARIWVANHPDLGWCPARVDSLDDSGNYIAVDDEGQQFKIPQDKATSVDASCLSGVEDLLTLGDFNEGCLLHNIRVRYFEDRIYTGIGTPILISINPLFKLTVFAPFGLWYIQDAGARLRYIFLIIITGESGAGKTEATKRVLNYIANLQSVGGTPSKMSAQNQVLKSNPILEAFGNAKTVRNDNSSRFGKFIEIQFDQQGKLKTANIRNYLLEKCRITAQQDNERNYHAFYQLCAGASDELSDFIAEDFDFVSVCPNIDAPEHSDAEDFMNVCDCLYRLRFSQSDIHTLWKCCAALLLLLRCDGMERKVLLESTLRSSFGNVNFDVIDDDRVEIADHATACPPICELLGISETAFRGVLRSRKFFDPISKNMLVSPLRLEQAKQVKLSIARVLYSRMFDWIVSRINASMQMEVFDWNSFEQLCINFANEKLQQHFNSHMFRMEQKLYTEENITWSHISWQDNQDVIVISSNRDCLEKKPSGVFPHLDSTCLGPNATDAAFLQALYTKPLKADISSRPFLYLIHAVAHYAGEVRYSVEGFLDKNFEKQTDEAIEVLKESSDPLIRKFVLETASSSSTSGAAGSGGAASSSVTDHVVRSVGAGRASGGAAVSDRIKGPQSTVSSTFREQLDALVADLNRTHPRYIRCIKPNADKAARTFDSIDVLRQLRCAGMLEAIRIRRAGYSVRRPFKEFLTKYGRLCPGLVVQRHPQFDYIFADNCSSVFDSSWISLDAD
ncbi:unnamed protein product, partial [Amoebophrya sp. A25]|eukprot:GSA25T00000270001.1